MINEEDKISLNEVISICQSVKNQNIEIQPDNLAKQKTIEFMHLYGINHDDIRNEIHHLTASDYHAGPVEDRNLNRIRPFWIFIKKINGIKIKVYIKIKITNHKKKVVVYSFHEEGLHDVSI